MVRKIHLRPTLSGHSTRAAGREDTGCRSYSLLLRLAGLVAGIMVLAACQDTLRVGALNQCGAPIEVDAGSPAVAEDLHWDRLDARESSYVKSVSESRTTLHVWVRANENAPVLEFSVAVEELSAPPDRSDYDVEIVLEGDRCP